uniref:Uncharacterized protein n=1 Tax=Pithovirus LCPAC202 TaxID=2506592 RepID=A0A481Z5U2_9VIRU|nr:MAG: hypothetical protein LCPAC202_01110 [Pithovirus LCPAC202]
MEPFRLTSHNPPINLSKIQNKELYIPLYIKDPETDEFEIVSMPVEYDKLIELFYSENRNNITKEDIEIENIFRSSGTKQQRDNNILHKSSKPNPRTLGISLDSNHGLTDSRGNTTNQLDSWNKSPQQNHNYFGHEELDAAATFLAVPPSADLIFQQNNSHLPGNSPVSFHSQNKSSNSIKIGHQSVNITDNIIYSFLKESCLESSSGLVSRNELQTAYQSWSQDRGQPSIAGSILADYLDPLYKTTKIKRKNYYVGLILK